MMEGKVSLADLFADEEFWESSPKKAKIVTQSLPIEDPMELEQPEENLPKPQYSSFITRISECFLRSIDILDSMGEQHFSDFVKRYHFDVEEGLELFECFRHAFENMNSDRTHLNGFAAVLSDITHENEYKDLREDGRLSIVNQLEQIRARWRTHQWIMQNALFIKMLKLQRPYYPLLLRLLAGEEIQLSNDVHPLSRFRLLSKKSYGNGVLLNRATTTLSAVDLEWLVELIYPHLNSQSLEDDIAKALSHRTNHESLLRFSAKIDQLMMINSMIIKAERITTNRLMTLIGKELDFFNSLRDGITNPNVINYLNANPQAHQFVVRIRDYYHLLVALLNIQDFNVQLNKSQLKTFRPLLCVLLEGLLNGRLEMLITLSKVGNSLAEQNQLKALTWLEKNREIIALTFKEENAWQSWVNQQQESLSYPNHLPLLLSLIRFSENIKKCLNAQCVDVRPGKQTMDEYPCALACFLDAISGLPAKDRSSLISSVENDVLLYQFLSASRNVSLVNHILREGDSVQIHIETFKDSIAEKRVAMLEQAMMENLNEVTNSPRKSYPNSPRKVVMPSPQKRSKREFENEEMAVISHMSI